ncbi:MAG: adenosylmethionine--8-amino-7-oxononanoate transaminase [Nibricoccus sp.]
MSTACSSDSADVNHSWHPFTQMSEYLNGPRLAVTRAQGCWLEDAAGRRYLDGNASIWTNVHGHNDPELNAALTRQLEKVAHTTLLGLHHPAADQLSARLAGLTSGRLPRVFYSDCGAMAVEIAVKMSLQYWQLQGRPERRRILAMEHAYHGDSFGTMALGDSGVFHQRFQPWFFPVDRFPAPYHEEVNGVVSCSDHANAIAHLSAFLRSHSSECACLVLEPFVQGAAGMRQQPVAFVREVAQLCRLHGVHLILDEVFVAFGRLGHLLAGESLGVHADFICLAKGLTAGYIPLAATLASEAIYRAHLGAWEEHRAFYHGHTFTGNPLGCAVALESITKLEKFISSGRLAEGIAWFGEAVEKSLCHRLHVRAVRQLGFAAAVDLGPADANARWSPGVRGALQVCYEARRRGLVLRPLGDSVLLVPPLAINRDEINFLTTTLAQSIATIAPSIPTLPVLP